MVTAVLKAENLTKSFFTHGAHVATLKGVSLAINSGEIVAFLGSSGAGKTTTTKILAGLIEPDSGIVQINGCDPIRDVAALRFIGTVLEGNRNLYLRLTANENLEYFGALKGLARREAKSRGIELLRRFSAEEDTTDGKSWSVRLVVPGNGAFRDMGGSRMGCAVHLSDGRGSGSIA